MAIWRVVHAWGLAAVLGASTPIFAQVVRPDGDPLATWVSQLRSPDLKVRLGAGYALQTVGSDAAAGAQRLIAHLRDPEAYLRAHVAAALGEFAMAPEMSIPALVAALRDPDRAVSDQAAAALGKLGEPAVPTLVDLLKHAGESQARDAAASGTVRSARQDLSTAYAIFVLGQIGSPALPPVISVYQAALAHGSDAAARPGGGPVQAACQAVILDAVPQAGRDAAALLLPLLDDPDRRARTLALEALSVAGKDASPATARLIRLLETSPAEELVRINSAIGVMAQVGGAAVPLLL
jgi:HEAT repeat protein